MNLEEKLSKKMCKLQYLEDAIRGGIDSQIRYLDYCEKISKLRKDIEILMELREKANKKIWVDMGDGWKKRIHKNE